MNREELIAYDKWLTRRKWGTGEIISPEKAADIYLAEHPLPPAEGAEEISAKQVFDNAYEFYRNMENNPAIPLEARELIFSVMHVFATLHAQRLAEKMVSERCKKCKYRGLPDSIQEALNSGDGVYRP